MRDDDRRVAVKTECVAVLRRLRDRLRADDAARTLLIDEHHRLPERRRLAMHVEVERVVDATIEHILEKQVEAVQTRKQVTLHRSGTASGKPFAYPRHSDRGDEQAVVVRTVREHAYVGVIALVSGARMG